jgi:hypothetical protein
MKSIAFANRLARSLDAKSFTELDADARLEILDAINGGLQKIHALAPPDSKITTASIYLAAPADITLGVTQGSAQITGYAFTADQLYCTIRVEGDGVDNQVIGETELLHPYAGPTGTVSAVVYGDASAIPEPYETMVGNPRILENQRELFPYTPPVDVWGDWRHRPIGEPRWYSMEANARNQNPPAPAVLRMDTLPSSALRLQTKFTLAPARVYFEDLLNQDSFALPIRQEHIEAYLLPICRGLLSTSDRWKTPDTRTATANKAEQAAAEYAALTTFANATPRNLARSKPGF